MQISKILRPDAKGRICLGALAEGVSGYEAIMDDETHEIILKPYTEIPFKEQWLFKNTKALNSVKKGLGESSKHEIEYKGSFSEFIEDEE
jgi:hypothetical protein